MQNEDGGFAKTGDEVAFVRFKPGQHIWFHAVILEEGDADAKTNSFVCAPHRPA